MNSWLWSSARFALSLARNRGATTCEDRLFWTTRAWRAARNSNHDMIAQCCIADASLAALFCTDSASCTDVVAATERIRALAQEQADNVIATINGSSLPPAKKENARTKVIRWIQMWSAKNRRVGAIAIRCADGLSGLVGNDAAQCLKSVWAPKFAPCHTEAFEQDLLLRTLDAFETSDAADWIISVEALVLSLRPRRTLHLARTVCLLLHCGLRGLLA